MTLFTKFWQLLRFLDRTIKELSEMFLSIMFIIYTRHQQGNSELNSELEKNKTPDGGAGRLPAAAILPVMVDGRQ